MIHRKIFAASPSQAYAIPSDRDLYLDTSVIRRLGRQLAKTKQIDRTYTSALTLIELLNGVLASDKEFASRRAAACSIKEARVPVDWQLPDARLRCAFESMRAKYDIYEEAVRCLRELVNTLVRHESRAAFARSERGLRLENDLDYFARMDRRISETCLSAYRSRVAEIRAQFRQAGWGEFLQYLGLAADLSLPQVASALAGSPFDCGFGLFAIATRFANEEERDDSYRDLLFTTYDGTLSLP